MKKQIMPPPSPPTPFLLLLLDWDSTLTTTSTLPLIASLSTLPHHHLHPALPSLTHSYLRDLQTHDEKYVPQRTERTSVELELRYLDSLRGVERASIERVEASGIFKGVMMGDGGEIEKVIRDVVERGDVQLRKGWRELCGRVQSRNGGKGKVGIVSVAWSRAFIRDVMRAHYCNDDGHRAEEGTRSSRKKATLNLTALDIRANEILPDGSGRLDRVFGDEGGIWTASDKKRIMDDIILTSPPPPSPTSPSPPPRTKTIYIGDSPTDLSCLLAADIGICIRGDDDDDVPKHAQPSEQKSLSETLARIGVGCVHVGGCEGGRGD